MEPTSKESNYAGVANELWRSCDDGSLSKRDFEEMLGVAHESSDEDDGLGIGIISDSDSDFF